MEPAATRQAEAAHGRILPVLETDGLEVVETLPTKRQSTVSECYIDHVARLTLVLLAQAQTRCLE